METGPKWVTRNAVCPSCKGLKDASSIKLFSKRGMCFLKCGHCKYSCTAVKWQCECGLAINLCMLHRDDPVPAPTLIKPVPIANANVADFNRPPMNKPKAARQRAGTHFAIIEPVPLGGTRLYSYRDCPKLQAKFPRLSSSRG